MITFDPLKREKALAGGGLEFEDAALVFAGETVDFQDLRRDYGEDRFVSIGHLRGRMVVIGWTPRGENRHVFSMRKANGREQKRYAERLGRQ